MSTSPPSISWSHFEDGVVISKGVEEFRRKVRVGGEMGAVQGLFRRQYGSGPGGLGCSESGYVTQWGRDQGDVPGRGLVTPLHGAV